MMADEQRGWTSGREAGGEPFAEKIRLAVTALVVVLVTVLIFQNQDAVFTRILVWSVEMPHFLLLGITFIVGGFAGYVVGRRLHR